MRPKNLIGSSKSPGTSSRANQKRRLASFDSDVNNFRNRAGKSVAKAKINCMHLHVDGMVKGSNQDGPGSLLLTDQSVFIFAYIAKITFTIPFGVIPSAIAGLIAHKKARANPPPHLRDPEILAFDPKMQKKFRYTKLLAKLALDSNLTVAETRMGYRIGSSDRQFDIWSWANKKKIAAFLAGRGVTISPR